tara:strand:- start:1079 stop:1558 length:480 start_codon:yes stop_codon:yes gene_type:complete
MCKCFEESLKRVKEHVFNKLDGTSFKDLKVDWVGYSYFLDGKPHVPVNPKVSIEYRGFKKNGDPKANLTKDDVTIMARYCPFCGEDTEAEPLFKPFKDLPKGTKFKYPDGNDVWVVLQEYNRGLIAKFIDATEDTTRQSLCSFCDDEEWSLDSEVEVVK